MTRFFAGGFAAALLLMGGVASAADLPIGAPVATPLIPVPRTWEGFYLGLNVGGHWASDKISTVTDPAGVFSAARAAQIDSASPATLTNGSGMGGVQGGYNWQFGQTVAGIEVDGNLIAGTAKRSVGEISLTDQLKQPGFLLTVRPRLGWAFDHRSLLYVTGGYAFGTVQAVDTFTIGVQTFQSDVTGKQSGWTAGLGYEYAFSRGVSAKIEYLYVDLGSFHSVIPVAPAASIDVTHRYTDNIVRVGVNFRPGW
jgi:outer membrane immunogenic protein